MVAGEEGLTVGLFGGTFDPVHQGHLDLALHVLDRCRLDRLLLIPALVPPHKRQPVAAFADRAAMIETALAACSVGRERMRCSRLEADLPPPSYTIHTVRALAAARPADRHLLIIGADSLLDLPHWHRIDDLLDLVSLIVVRRAAIEPAAIDRALAALAPGFTFDPSRNQWLGRGGQTADYFDDIELPVSSSAIREDLAAGRVPAMLPPPVFAYIRDHRLYGWREAS